MFAFFNDLHINLNVAIEKRENLDATDRETISVQNIDFLDVAIDKNSSEDFEEIEIADDSTTNFDDVKTDEMIDWNDETKNEKIIDRDDVKDFDSKTNETTN